jgi:hypothetical protein
MRLAALLLLLLAPLGAACGGDDGPSTGNENELITNVTLTFVPADGGATVMAQANDPDGDGGAPPEVEPIVLVAFATYTLTVQVRNTLEEPPEEITDEVRDEAENHQVFLTGTAVTGPASAEGGAYPALNHTYADMDANGLPIGLANTVRTYTRTGELIVTLRHMPPINGVPQKVADLATQVRTGGFAAIGGTTDASVTFMVTVP